MTAADIMTRDVITVKAETTIEELGRILAEHRISGAPVVDDDAGLVGIVTENDLIRSNTRLHIPTVVRLFDAIIPLTLPGALLDEMKRVAASTVEDICVRDVLTISPDTTVAEIANIMAEKGFHLLPVVEDGRLAGIVGKVDVVKALR